jgi:hypothetical protein
VKEEVEEKKKREEEMQKVLKTQEAFEKQKRAVHAGGGGEIETDHTEPLRQNEGACAPGKKTICPGGRNRRMQKTRGSIPLGQTEEQEEEQRHLQAERKKEPEEAER